MKRIVTAGVLIPLVVFAIFSNIWWVLLGFVALIAIACWYEYANMFELDWLTLTLGAAGGLALLVIPIEHLIIPLLIFSLITLTLPFREEDLQAGMSRAAIMFLGVVYIFGAMKTAYQLGILQELLLLFALAINWVGDTGAYYVGRRFGKHKMTPRISPGKSWEGAAASILFAALFTTLGMHLFLNTPLLKAAVFGILGNVAGQIGDLAESAMKRGAGLKDSGTLLPGHGGMLDRVDSALFTLPVAFAIARWMHL
jgi:phosphatidate cytidylyltransferase